jgi:hypothetical protein
MPRKTNSSSIGRVNVDLVRINCRGLHDAKFSSRLLFPFHPMAVNKDKGRPKKVLEIKILM